VQLKAARTGLAGLVFDSGAATHQSSELAALAFDGLLRDRVIASVLAKRAELADESGASSIRVAVERLDDGNGASALIARGEVLVVDPGQDSGVELLQRLGYRILSSVGPILRLRRPNAEAVEVASVCQALRALGVTAGPNYVTAAGPVAKGALGIAAPALTKLDLGRRPAGDLRGSGVRVVVIDTGIDRSAVEASNGWLDSIEVDDGPTGNRDLLDSVPAPDGFLDDGAGHGTFVAGVVRQMAPACEVTAVRALDSDGVGTEFATAEALFDLADSDAPPHVVNLSLACLASETLAPIAMSAALEALRERHPDTVIVAAAGNDGSAVPTWPATHKTVLSVGALEGQRPARYSNRGHWVDFSVPADGVVSTYVQGTRVSKTGNKVEHAGAYAAWSGTSFAAPQVAGQIAALMGGGARASQAIAMLRRESWPAGEAGRILAQPWSLTYDE
jgi:subtilisin family serine protease